MRISPQLVLADLSLVARTALAGLLDDPLQFLLLVARRLKLLRPPKAKKPTLLNALHWFLADRPEVAAQLLPEIREGKAAHRRLHRWLSTQLGLLNPSENDPARLRWLAANLVGDLSGALAVSAPGSRARRRTSSELRILAPAPGWKRHHGGHGPVLFVLTNSLPYTKSGYTTRTQAILSALHEQGGRVEAVTRVGYPTTIGRPGAPKSRVVGGIRYRRLPVARLPLEMDQRLTMQSDMIVELAQQMKPALLHTTTDYTNGVATRDAAAQLGIPWVYEMRGQLENTWVTNRPAPLRDAAAKSERVKLLQDKETELARSANAVIVLSEVQKQDLIERGIEPSHIWVVPNSVDASLLHGHVVTTEARSALGLPQDGFWVGSVSSLVGYEGFDTLLRAVKALRDAGIDARCLLVGDGAARPSLEGLAHTLGIAEHVVFPGRQPKEQARMWFQALDVFVVPRIDSTVTRMVTPLKIVEAMALRRPVVASDLPALQEFVSDGRGLAFAPEDSAELASQLELLHRSESLRSSLVEAAYVFASDRTWQNAAKKILEIYEKDCGGEIR